MDIVKEILDNIINYSIFFNDDENIKNEYIEKYIIYLQKKINNNFCDSFFEKSFSIKNVNDVISIKDYLKKLIIKLQISNSVIISSIIYLERLNIDINIYNIHIVLLISLLLSSKFLEDLFYNNNYWSLYGGISLDRLNKLEKFYLIKIKNKLFIHFNEFYEKFNEIFLEKID
jgi:hypothetical protein